MLPDIDLTEPAVIFTSFDESVNWSTAKSKCEDLGQRLAVLDTKEKLMAFREQK